MGWGKVQVGLDLGILSDMMLPRHIMGWTTYSRDISSSQHDISVKNNHHGSSNSLGDTNFQASI